MENLADTSHTATAISHHDAFLGAEDPSYSFDNWWASLDAFAQNSPTDQSHGHILLPDQPEFEGPNVDSSLGAPFSDFHGTVGTVPSLYLPDTDLQYGLPATIQNDDLAWYESFDPAQSYWGQPDLQPYQGIPGHPTGQTSTFDLDSAALELQAFTTDSPREPVTVGEGNEAPGTRIHDVSGAAESYDFFGNHVLTKGNATDIASTTEAIEARPSHLKPQSMIRKKLVSLRNRFRKPSLTATETRAKKKQPRISASNTRLLEERFSMNAYPSRSEYEDMSRLTGEPTKRIYNWFSNARSRKPAPGDADCLERTADPVSLKESLENITKDPSPGLRDPIEVYLSSSVEDEAANVQDIVAASKIAAPDTRLKFKLRANPFWSSKPLVRKGPRPAASSRASSASAKTDRSSFSQHSNASVASRSRRRGRRRFGPGPPLTLGELMTAAQGPVTHISHPPKFHCTFCWKTFSKKPDWSRHEETVHMPQKSWVCCGFKEEDLNTCPFCKIPAPVKDHLDMHNYPNCAEKPEDERTFYRKDHFLQHVRKAHVLCESDVFPLWSDVHESDNKLYQALAQSCFKKPPPLPRGDPALHCGFCGKTFPDWKTRSGHVAEHFGNPTSTDDNYMASWWPGRLDATFELQYRDVARHYRCPTCKDYFHEEEAHLLRSVWSCRFVKNAGCYLDPAGNCYLCGVGTGMYLLLTGTHADEHRYRECSQEMFFSWKDMKRHLEDLHGADGDLLEAVNSAGRPVLFERFTGRVCPYDPGFTLSRPQTP
ncbi:hypothetical protein M011DRAFT_487091 [Sporormia fimetaria CBS 119925]|uniref:Homeobox domain-containing protein n=1 Tax=Sporormia fimetaria CBS 119925 TaxID=1340428 RepID=A0A6A6V7U5_9PLEO|nr:hypothetical protein M011DRAFT_487091 [Sporormia fimetaria CBS 119925]